MVDVTERYWNISSTLGQRSGDAESLRVAGRIFVNLLSVYAGHADLARRIRKLLDQPRRDRSQVTFPTGTVRRKRHVGAQEVIELVATYQAGATVAELAERFGIHRTRVSKLLKQAGVQTRYHETADVDLQRANELQLEGLTITETAEAMGVGRSTLVRARRRARGIVWVGLLPLASTRVRAASVAAISTTPSTSCCANR